MTHGPDGSREKGEGIGIVDRRLLTDREAADRLRLGLTKTRELIKSGELRSIKIDWARRIPEEAIGEYIDRLAAEQGASERVSA